MSDRGPIPITASDLLLVDPNAYINLWLLLSDGDPEKHWQLNPNQHQLLLVGPHEAVLLCKSPPMLLGFDKKDHAWKQIAVKDKPQAG